MILIFMRNIIFFFDYNNVVKIYITKWIIKKFMNALINYRGMTHFLWHFITEIDLISKMKKIAKLSADLRWNLYYKREKGRLYRTKNLWMDGADDSEAA